MSNDSRVNCMGQEELYICIHKTWFITNWSIFSGSWSVCKLPGCDHFTLCLLSSSRQFVSLREAFMELSENMCTAVEMVPSVNSANFKLSSRESDNWICTQTHKQTYLNLVSHVLITLSSTTNWVYHVTSLFGLYRTSVMESNLKLSFRVFFSLPVFWPSTTAAVTTVFPTTINTV